MKARSEDKSYIASVGLESPRFLMEQTEAWGFLEKHYSGRLSPRGRGVMKKVFAHPSIRTRRFAFDSPECLVEEDPDARINRFTERAIELSSGAVRGALSRAGLRVEDVSALVVNTCTGYVCPGLSTYLMEELGLSRKVRAYDLVGGGCGGAIPNLQMCDSLLRVNGEGAVLSVSVEICTATFQMEDDLSLIVSNAIFADGAAASVVWSRPEGLELLASGSRYAPEHRDAIRYVHKNGQLHNRLSVTLPRLVGDAAFRVVTDVLGQASLNAEDVSHWAVHPGGEKIIDSLREGLGLSEDKLSAARSVLSRYGNMSSPTVWFVLREIMDAGMESGDFLMMLAFGAGLSAHAFLLMKA
jgi:alkylresorcinol/alkylpyrone synthase